MKKFGYKIFPLVFALISGCGIPAPQDNYSSAQLEEQAVQIVKDGLSDSNPRIRVMSTETVAVTKKTQLIPGTQKLLKDDFVPVRFSAALAMGDLRYKLAEGQLKLLMAKDPDENVKIAASYALNKLSSSDNYVLIVKALRSRNQTLRANAAMLLGKSGDRKMLKPLYDVMTNENSDDKTSFQAAEAIARLGDENIYSKLWTMLISKFADDRIIGTEAMGSLGTKDAKNALIRMLSDPVMEVRLASARQLGELGDTTGEPEVLEVFIKPLPSDLTKEDVERINIQAALAIGQIGTESLKRYLPQLLNNESAFVRLAAAKAVLQCSGRKIKS